MRPMLAPINDPLRDPLFFDRVEKAMKQCGLLCSPKLDGIRGLVANDPVQDFDSDFKLVLGAERIVVKSREWYDIPSVQVQKNFGGHLHLDGEIIEGNETDLNVYNRTQSFVMSENKPSDNLAYRVFDCCNPILQLHPFHERHEAAKKLVDMYNGIFDRDVSIVEHTWIDSMAELLEYEETQLKLGYEGIMMRHPMGKYKHGRATWDEGTFFKLKRFEQEECELIGIVEQKTNNNILLEDNLGYAKRSTAKEGLEAAGTTGGLIGRMLKDGTEITASCGILTHPERKEIYDNPQGFIGNFFTCRFMRHGMKNLPRHPRFVGWRSKIDFSSEEATW